MSIPELVALYTARLFSVPLRKWAGVLDQIPALSYAEVVARPEGVQRQCIWINFLKSRSCPVPRSCKDGCARRGSPVGFNASVHNNVNA